MEHYLQSILTSSYPAPVGTFFTINFLARLTLLLLGYYLPFIINLYSRVISEFWCFLIMNMEDGEGGA